LALRGVAFGHCDTMDGPVAMEATAALEKGDVTPVLKWVREEHEEEVRSALSKVMAVRAKGPEAKELADTFFLETVVRLHRAGEGEPYTGIKPAGQVEPPVAAADRAVAENDVGGLAKKIGRAAEKGVRERFERLSEAKKRKEESIGAGREYVSAYIEFIHYVEEIHRLVAAGSTHYHE